MKTARKIANTGDFVSRIENNVKLGWVYPKNVIVVGKEPRGKWGNASVYYFFNGVKMNFITSIPSWAGRNGKYKSDYDRIDEYEKKSNGLHYLQSFIKERK